MNTDDRKWEIIESEYLIRRPWLTARRDRVKLPTGVEIPEYYILEYPDWVNVIAITKEGKFVLVRQYRHGIKETRYEICAGVCETGEEPLLFAFEGRAHGRELRIFLVEFLFAELHHRQFGAGFLGQQYGGEPLRHDRIGRKSLLCILLVGDVRGELLQAAGLLAQFPA